MSNYTFHKITQLYQEFDCPDKPSHSAAPVTRHRVHGGEGDIYVFAWHIVFQLIYFNSEFRHSNRLEWRAVISWWSWWSSRCWELGPRWVGLWCLVRSDLHCEGEQLWPRLVQGEVWGLWGRRIRLSLPETMWSQLSLSWDRNRDRRESREQNWANPRLSFPIDGWATHK